MLKECVLSPRKGKTHLRAVISGPAICTNNSSIYSSVLSHTIVEEGQCVYVLNNCLNKPPPKFNLVIVPRVKASLIHISVQASYTWRMKLQRQANSSQEFVLVRLKYVLQDIPEFTHIQRWDKYSYLEYNQKYQSV